MVLPPQPMCNFLGSSMNRSEKQEQLALFPEAQGSAKQRRLAADACDRILDALAALTLGDNNWKYAENQLWHADRIANEI